jgi:hypothetical protein
VIAHRQWREAKAHADAQGVALMGGHSFWHQLLQRRRLRPARTVCARLVGRRAPGTVFQRRCFYPKMGAKLGYSPLPLGGDAQLQFRLVAAARAWGARDFPSLPHRPRARVLSHLCFPLATEAAIANSSPLAGRRCARAPRGRVPPIRNPARTTIGKTVKPTT